MQVHSHIKWKCVQISLSILSNEFFESQQYTNLRDNEQQ
jgi:hypothetical protein